MTSLCVSVQLERTIRLLKARCEVLQWQLTDAQPSAGAPQKPQSGTEAARQPEQVQAAAPELCRSPEKAAAAAAGNAAAVQRQRQTPDLAGRPSSAAAAAKLERSVSFKSIAPRRVFFEGGAWAAEEGADSSLASTFGAFRTPDARPEPAMSRSTPAAAGDSGAESSTAWMSRQSELKVEQELAAKVEREKWQVLLNLQHSPMSIASAQIPQDKPCLPQ
jgi:hypothetical protein